MLPGERKQYILERLKHDGSIIAKTLSEELALSEDTIRRDLRELAQQGLLQRVHGGALPASPAIQNFPARTHIATDAKAMIGQYAAQLIQKDQIIMLDGGTTALQLVQHLPPALQVTIVTHSPSVAVALANHPGSTVILIGGTLYKHSIVSAGITAIETIRRIHADIYFMGVTGVHAEHGLTTGNYEEAQVKNALHQQAAETYVLASNEKINTVSPYQICAIDNIDGIITDATTPDSALLPYYENSISVMQTE